MKAAAFITQRDFDVLKGDYTWNIPYKNNRDIRYEPRNGILNVKKDFALKGEVEKVVLRATALGVFRLYVNGKRVGTEINGKTVYDEMKPGWTDYRFRVFEFVYDITALCQETNTFLCDIAPGWWNGRISFGIYEYKANAFAGEIEILYRDGTSELIASDESWDVMTGGPVRRADIWDGQYDDKTLPHPSIEPESYVWEKAILFDGFTGEIVPIVGAPIRVRDGLTRRPISAVVYDGAIPDGSEMGAIRVVTKSVGNGCEALTLKAGERLILDFGQEMVGRPELTVTASRGTKIETYFSELLNDSGERSRGNDGPKGSPYIANYRSALARYICVTSGESRETCAATHVFYGFRYLEICADGDVTIHAVKGEVIGSDLTETGTFLCDNPEVNQLYSNVVWGMRGNYLSIPTDCPQRDERLGWTGDTHIFCGAASYLADIKAFMHKWLGDARHSQEGWEGAYCAVIPRVLPDGADAAWADAALIVPYRLWLMYHDDAILAEHYESMEWYMQHLERFGLNGPKATYGDWLNYDVTDGAYVGVCYYAYDAELMALFSDILGKADRAAYYRELRERIIDHWKELYLKDGALTIKTQTAYLLPLAFDMVPAERKASFIETLRQLIVDNDYTLSTGFVGTGILNQTLSKVGLHDLCYSLLLQTKDPSWLYSVRQGATTIWERWNSYTKETGFGNVDMNSFNHYAYGAVAEWLYAGMCGIQPDPKNPGFDHFLLTPTPDMREVLPEGQKRIGFASATYKSIAGVIESGWKFVEDGYVYDFVIPAGTTADVSLISRYDTLLFNGTEMTARDLSATRNGDRLTFTLSAGRYSIRVD